MNVRERSTARHDTRDNLVRVAAALLRDHGPDAVTTRAVADAAGVQAPTIYRLFGDKDGLLDAVAEHAFTEYVAAEAHVDQDPDPVADLRMGWTTHIGFGLANPSAFALLIDPARPGESPAAAAGLRILQARVHRVATAGLLRVSERRAVEILYAAGCGAVLVLISVPSEARSPELADDMYNAVVGSILTQAPATCDDAVTTAAVTLRALAPQLSALTAVEQALLVEWLDRPHRPTG